MQWEVLEEISRKRARMNIRSQIAQIVNQITPIDSEESLHKDMVLKWIASGADLFRVEKPATPKMHLVSYFIPIDLLNEKIMLVHHRKANLWLPPGGHVDLNEHPRETVSREMEEELFTKAVFLMDQPIFLTVTETVNDASPHTDVSLWYLVEGNAEANYSFDEQEFHQIQWFSLSDLPTSQTAPQLSRFRKKFEDTYFAPPIKEGALMRER